LDFVNGAQIKFVELTPDAHLRHSKFVALRDDKDARTVTRGTATKLRMFKLEPASTPRH
jgi:ATP-dependent DNA ligase